MYLNKLENLEPYKDIDGDLGIGFSSGEIHLNLTNKQRRFLLKLEREEELLEKEFPSKKENFKAGVRQSVINIKTCYRYKTNQKLQKEIRRYEHYIGSYNDTKTNSEFGLYGRFIGGIDAKLDSIQNSIEVEKRFNRTNTKLNNKKQELLSFREKVVKDYFEESDIDIKFYEVLSEAIKTYPSYSKFGELYEKLKYGIGPQVMDLVTYFCSAYNDGYSQGCYLTQEELEAEYDKSIAQLITEKEINEKEYRKQITRTRRK